jgi:ABC-type sugar transport system permease subunit
LVNLKQKIATDTKVRRYKFNMEDRQAAWFCYLMVGVPFLFFLVFWVYVNISSVTLAFVDSFGEISFKNFKMVFDAIADKDMYGWNLGGVIWRTFLLWFYVNILCVLPSMFSSYILYKKIIGAYVFRIIFMIPTILGGMTWIMIMKYMVAANGPVLPVLQSMGMEFANGVHESGLLGDVSSAFATISIVNVLPKVIGFNIIITGAYARIPNDLFEVGKLEGNGFTREFFTISVPLIWPTIVISMITNLASILTFEGGVFLYTQGESETATMGFYLYYMTMKIAGSADVMTPFYGYPAAVGVLATAITIPIVLFGKYVLEKAVETVEY